MSSQRESGRTGKAGTASSGRRRRVGALTKVLVVNAGSMSLKLSVVDEHETSEPVASIDAVPDDVGAVGHRVVHGGARFRDPVVVDDEVTEAIRELSPLAPLHNTPALSAIGEARRALPELEHVAVFDTAFHATIPDEAATYAVPARWRDEWGVRRYGFHGLAVAWVAERVPVRRLVVCHLGGGCSVTAVLDGRSVDTTMGFSPLEGVPMATRSGSVDPGALLYLLREEGLAVDELDRALEHESGLAALGGLDDALGFAVYTYRIAQAAAAMATALGGIDALAFSGGVGENREDVRRAIADRLGFLGRFRVEVVPAREDVVVARAVRALRSIP
jgi:acetate kinase